MRLPAVWLQVEAPFGAGDDGMADAEQQVRGPRRLRIDLCLIPPSWGLRRLPALHTINSIVNGFAALSLLILKLTHCVSGSYGWQSAAQPEYAPVCEASV